MNIKQINAALRRVEVPNLSPTQREAFTAGVRALAYELEKDATPGPTLTDQLSTLVSKVFNNKDAFLEHFDLLGKVDTVEGFYMAGDRCIVMYEDWQNPQPQDISATIKTTDFLEWAHDQN